MLECAKVLFVSGARAFGARLLDVEVRAFGGLPEMLYLGMCGEGA
jgi:hypothetical protein